MNDWTWIALDITSQPKDDLHHEDPWYANVNWVEASRIALALVELGGSGHPSIPNGLGRSVEDGVRSLLHNPVQIDRLDMDTTPQRLSAMTAQSVQQTLATKQTGQLH